jgi:hypothetical protein
LVNQSTFRPVDAAETRLAASRRCISPLAGGGVLRATSDGETPLT